MRQEAMMTNQGESVRCSEEIVARANERIRGTFAGVLGMRFTYLAPERVEATLKVRQDLKQPWGIVHGGAVMTLADTVAGAGAYMNLGQDQETVTVELKINLIGAVREGTIRAEALPLHRGRSTSIWEARITDETGRLVAISLSTHLVLAPRPR
jgi:1,4-dihydroxy-2-naphthoyl-CoA hydrolase